VRHSLKIFSIVVPFVEESTWVWQYKELSLHQLWSDKAVFQFLSYDESVAGQFAASLLDNLLGYQGELTKVGRSNKEGPTKEPAFEKGLAGLYKELLEIYRWVKEDSPLFTILHSRRFLMSFAKLLHTPDKSEHGMISSLLSRVGDMAWSQNRIALSQGTFKVFGAIIQTGIYDFQMSQREVTLRPIGPLLRILAEYIEVFGS
jgi:hypothetical protein